MQIFYLPISIPCDPVLPKRKTTKIKANCNEVHEFLYEPPLSGAGLDPGNLCLKKHRIH